MDAHFATNCGGCSSSGIRSNDHSTAFTRGCCGLNLHHSGDLSRRTGTNLDLGAIENRRFAFATSLSERSVL